MEQTCIHFKGDRPCKPYWDNKMYSSFNCSKSCPSFKTADKRILLIKLDAMGDVLRTTPLAEAIKKANPHSHLTWLVAKSGYYFLKNNPFIDRIIVYEPNEISFLYPEEFDLLINLDKDKKATSLANRITSKEKRGFLLSKYGTPYPANEGAKYLFEIALDNWGAKTRNKKFFEQMVFDTAEIPYNNEKYFLKIDENDLEFAEKFKVNLEKSKPIIGINTGCGPVYPYKKWHTSGIIDLIKKLKSENKQVILFGGPDEKELNSFILSQVEVIDAGVNNTIGQFAALLKLCDVVFTGDTVGLHIAIAFEKNTVCVFGPTPSQEINIRKGIKLVGKTNCLNCYNQFPCIMEKEGNPTCMQTISIEEVLNAINSFLK